MSLDKSRNKIVLKPGHQQWNGSFSHRTCIRCHKSNSRFEFSSGHLDIVISDFLFGSWSKPERQT